MEVRTFEKPSLRYSGAEDEEQRTLGGWNLCRDEQFAHLINAEILNPGDVLIAPDGFGEINALVTTDYGIAVNGIRYKSPNAAAAAVTRDRSTDGWAFWQANTASRTDTLKKLALLHPFGELTASRSPTQ